MKNFFLLFGFLLFSSQTFALCTCERVSLALGISKSSNIFHAKVIKISENQLSLKMVKTFKGKFLEKITLGSADCAPEFNVGDENIFYLNNDRIETQCDHFFSVSDKLMYQQFIKLI
jgi:hypothetical protein